MRKVLLVIVLVESLKSTLFGAMAIQNDLSNFREKRHSEDHSAGHSVTHDPIQAVYCIQECRDTFERKLETQFGIRSNQLLNGLFNRRLYDGNNFQEFCKGYKEVSDCFAKCHYFKEKKSVLEIFKPFDYVCIERYEDFIRNMPCFRKPSKKLDRCERKCHGEVFVNEKLVQIAQLRKTKNFNGMLKIMGEVCYQISCSLLCEMPIYDKVCQDTYPGNLLESFITLTVKESQRNLEKAGIKSFPESCKKLALKSDALKPAVSVMVIFISVIMTIFY